MYEAVSFTIIVAIISLWTIRRWLLMRTFIYLGIPGPNPNFITGNIGEISSLGEEECLRKWRKEYGQIYGYWMGGNPILVVSDPETLKRIQINDFENFNRRPKKVFNSLCMKIPPFLLPGEEKVWRKNRAIMTASLTTEKIKKMIPLMKTEIAVMMNKLAQRSSMGAEFDILEYFRTLVLDTVGKTFFSIENNSKNYRLLCSLEKMMKAMVKPSYIRYFHDCFPEINFLFQWFINLIDIIASFVGIPLPPGIALEEAKLIMRKRLECPKTSDPDLLQLLINAEKNGNASKVVSITTANESEIPESERTLNTKSAVCFAEENVTNRILGFLISASPGLTHTLSYLSFVLVKQPEIQEKLRAEIKNVLFEKEGLDFNSIQQLKYMDQVISEALRTAKTTSQFARRITLEDISYGDLKIPKGMTVLVSQAILHRSEDFWDDPETFRPERFSTENRSSIRQMVFQPFGHGPRNCVGMRYALLQMKLTLATILTKYRLITAGKTSDLKMSFSGPDSLLVKAERL